MRAGNRDVTAPAPDDDVTVAAAGPTATPDWSRRTCIVMVLVLAVVAFAASFVVYRTVFPLYSGDRDEGVYVFQAHMLLDGKVSLPAQQYGEFFRPWLTGERAGRIFTEYQVGLPAFLAASQRVFGSMRFGMALVAGLTALTMYGFVYELLRERRTAVVAAALFSLSPIMLVHSALILTYPLMVFGLTAAGWGLLRAARTRRFVDVLIGGLALGFVVLTRPFDVVLFTPPVLALCLWRASRTEPLRPALVRFVGGIATGVAPFVLATFWYNAQATGSALKFPNMTADRLNTFGFGDRRLVVTEPLIRYDVGDAFHALGSNLAAVPSWTFGGVLLLAVAVFGVIVLRRNPERITLIALALVFPIGYFFWWATKLSGSTALNGLGPHYYLPSFIPIAALGAYGLTRLLERRHRALIVLAIVALIGATAWSVPDKYRANHDVSNAFRDVQRLVPSNLDHALVFVHTEGPQYLLAEYPFFQTDPDLGGKVVFAIDRGAANAKLMRAMPGRTPYRLRRELRAGDTLLAPTGSLTELHADTARKFTVSVAANDIPPAKYARAFLSDGSNLRQVALGSADLAAHRTVAWRISTTEGRDLVTVLPTTNGVLSVGIETSNDSTFTAPSRWESRIDYSTAGPSITTVTPGIGWELAQFPNGPAELRSDVSHAITVDVRR